MPAPNDVEITRVYTRQPGGGIADVTFAQGAPIEVIVEAEAGNAIFSGGGPYEIGVTIRNLTDSSIAVHNVTATGALTDPSWSAEANQQIFGGFVPGPVVPQGAHIYEVIAYVKVGALNPDVSFARSPLFIVHEG